MQFEVWDISSDGDNHPLNYPIGLCPQIFLVNHPFNYPENLVTNFSERKDTDFCCVQINGDICTLSLLITLCNMPKGLVT